MGEPAIWFPVTPDGQPHVYLLAPTPLGPWQDAVTRFRLDPCDAEGKFVVDHVRFW